jgi:hypothetical protein
MAVVQDRSYHLANRQYLKPKKIDVGNHKEGLLRIELSHSGRSTNVGS